MGDILSDQIMQMLNLIVITLKVIWGNRFLMQGEYEKLKPVKNKTLENIGRTSVI